METLYEWVIEPLAPYKFWVDMAAVISAGLTAYLWWKASLVKMPGGPIALVHPHFEHAIMDVTRRQSEWNARAAKASALAAALTGLSVLVGTRWG
jgi:hypothetical protein